MMCSADPACVLPASPGEMCAHHQRMFSGMYSGGRSSLPRRNEMDTLDGIVKVLTAATKQKLTADELRRARSITFPPRSTPGF